MVGVTGSIPVAPTIFRTSSSFGVASLTNKHIAAKRANRSLAFVLSAHELSRRLAAQPVAIAAKAKTATAT
jgi:hypothetical protein